ncbi:MAG: HAD-IA family hydrolase [Dehalococcoidales bacterium]|nr:HAD-IA family hydrolase [Dehalococcoidales bacterium]
MAKRLTGMEFKEEKIAEVPETFLFDLDDTLITDGGLSEKAWRDVCREFAPLIGIAGTEELYQAIRRAADSFWQDPENHRTGRLDLAAARRHVVGQAFRDLGLEDFALSDRVADSFSDRKDRAISLVDGAMEVLLTFKERGCPLALLTNGGSAVQRGKIERFRLAPFFECILIEGEFGTGKPDERIFRAALENLHAAPSRSWMVGDDLERDIAGAQKLGIGTIWMDWKKAGLAPYSRVRPDRTIQDLRELLNGLR